MIKMEAGLRVSAGRNQLLVCTCLALAIPPRAALRLHSSPGTLLRRPEARVSEASKLAPLGLTPGSSVTMSALDAAGPLASAVDALSSPAVRSAAWPAFAMTLAAGSSTGVGALLVCFVNKLDRRLSGLTMAFSSGVMVYVSLVEVVQVSVEKFELEHAADTAYLLSTLCFFLGGVLMALTGELVHTVFEQIASEWRVGRLDIETPGMESDEGGASNVPQVDPESAAIESVLAARNAPSEAERRELLRMSTLIGVAIALHNIPEGIATYVASFHSLQAGVPLTLAIAVHNIPEGLAVAMPVLRGTGSQMAAIFWGGVSGLAEPLGALLAYLIVNPTSSESSFGALFAASAGMMVFVSLSELLPAAYRDTPSPNAVARAFFAGCLVMASSLVLERLGR